MTENISERIDNAIEDIEKMQIIFRQIYGEECLADKEIEEVLKIAKEEHKELEQYRSIGTVEECREEVERQNKIISHERDNCGRDRRFKIGDIVQHFKRETVSDKERSTEYLYVICGTAIHSETKEKLMVYHSLYKINGDYITCARPYDMFVGEVDREKYPEIKQKYRFELFDMARS